MMGSGAIDNSKIVTSHYPLAQAVDAIAKSVARADGKIIVHPQA
jgi:threonine dehydrogenase-like Zn-dependent dehydrogenase